VQLISRHCPGDDPATVAAKTLTAMPEHPVDRGDRRDVRRAIDIPDIRQRHC
jgi:hypothetical protein